MPNNTDSFGEYDPTSPTNAFAPTQTPAMVAEAQRQEALLRQAQAQRDAARLSENRTALITSGQKTAAPSPGKWGTGSTTESRGKTANYDTNVWDDVKKIWTSDPVTTGVLAAPYLVAGAGALLPAAGAGPGITTPITAAPSYGAVGTMTSPFGPGTAVPTLGSVGTVASPFAAAAPPVAGSTLPAMAGATPAVAKGFGLAEGLTLGKFGLDVGGIVASQIRTKAENDLIEKQKELAAAAKARQVQVQQEGMNRLGQQMLAFVPQNRMMAEMFGPEAAFTGQQMGQMAADPGANQAAAGQAFDNNNPGANQFSMEDIARANADRQRQQQVSGAFGPPPRGPAPLQPRTPQPARRF